MTAVFTLMALLIGEAGAKRWFLTLSELCRLSSCCLIKLCSVDSNCGPVATDQFAIVLLLDVKSERGSKAAFLPMLKPDRSSLHHKEPMYMRLSTVCSFIRKRTI